MSNMADTESEMLESHYSTLIPESDVSRVARLLEPLAT